MASTNCITKREAAARWILDTASETLSDLASWLHEQSRSVRIRSARARWKVGDQVACNLILHERFGDWTRCEIIACDRHIVQGRIIANGEVVQANWLQVAHVSRATM